jgi:hypothetical protein
MDVMHLVQNPVMDPIDLCEYPVEVSQNIGLRLAAAEGLTEAEALDAFIEALPDTVTTDKGDIRLMFVVS